MKRGIPIDIMTDETVDFLDVPRENVVDLRSKTQRIADGDAMPPPPISAKPRQLHRGPGFKTFIFFALVLLVLLPVVAGILWQRAQAVKGKVLGVSADAYGSLIAAADALQQLNTVVAEKEFSDAQSAFQSARNEVDRYGLVARSMAAVLPLASKIRSGQALLKAGEDVARAGAELSSIVDELTAADGEEQLDFTKLLSVSQDRLTPALDALDRALRSLKAVKAADIPSAEQQKFQQLLETLPELSAALEKFRGTAAFVSELLGGRRAQRYLVLFENNLELRPTGGFIGSMALIDIAGGKVTNLEAPSGGSYALQGQLTDKVIAPEPLHLVNPHWQLQDANWWPDFPTSAEKIQSFYEKSGGVTVDGIIAVTTDVLVDLLAATGPVDLMEDYGVTVTADNVVDVILDAIEKEKESTAPKRIIGDLLPAVLAKVFQEKGTDKLAVAAAFERALVARQLLLFFQDPGREAQARELGWAGELKTSPKDFLAVVDTNIGGGKTDGVIDETIEHRATIADNGSIEVTLTLTRVHRGSARDERTGVRNIDYVRFYVPKGSTFLAAEGFERIDPKRFQLPDTEYQPDAMLTEVSGRPIVDQLTSTTIADELGHTVFANWMGVGPGETAKASMTYRLPFALSLTSSLLKTGTDEYSVLFQKQAGSRPAYLLSEVRYPKGFSVTPAVPTGAETTKGNQVFQLTTQLATDQFYGLVLTGGR